MPTLPGDAMSTYVHHKRTYQTSVPARGEIPVHEMARSQILRCQLGEWCRPAISFVPCHSCLAWMLCNVVVAWSEWVRFINIDPMNQPLCQAELGLQLMRQDGPRNSRDVLAAMSW